MDELTNYCDNQIPDLFQQNMNSELIRLATFEHVNMAVCKRKLACFGFYSLYKKDHVQCNFCFVIIGNWNWYDHPLVEHYYQSPCCPLIAGEITLNIPLSSIDIPHTLTIKLKGRHPAYANYYDRMDSFSEWPKILSQKPEQLATAGFFYLQTGDQVKCYYCGGALKDWEQHDWPIAEHLRHFKHKCEFIRKFDKTPNSLENSVVAVKVRSRRKSTKRQLDLLYSFDKHISDKVLLNQKWTDLARTLNSLGPAKSTSEWKCVRRHLMYNKNRRKSQYDKDFMLDDIQSYLNQNIDKLFN